MSSKCNKGTTMKNGSFFLRKQDLFIGTMLVAIVASLLYQGIFTYYSATGKVVVFG